MKTTTNTTNPELMSFASDVALVARSLHSWVGESFSPGTTHKVLVADLLSFFGGDATTVKAWLLAAHRAGLIEMVRADLPGLLDAGRVMASEITYMGSSLHFVRL